MNRFLLNLAKVLFCSIATFAANNVARAGDPPQTCTLQNNRDPEVKTVYTGTVQLWNSGGSSINPRIGWQCFLHNTSDGVSVELDITTPDGEHPPYYFSSVETSTSQLPGFTMVVVEFYPNCYSKCATEPKIPMGKYTVTFKSLKK